MKNPIRKIITILSLFALSFSVNAQFANTLFLQQATPKIDCRQVGHGYFLITPSWNTTNVDSIFFPTLDTTSTSAVIAGDSIITGITTVTTGLVGLQMGLTVTDNKHDSVFVYVNRGKTPVFSGPIVQGNNPIHFTFLNPSLGIPAHISAYCKLNATGGGRTALKEKWFFSYINY